MKKTGTFLYIPFSSYNVINFRIYIYIYMYIYTYCNLLLLKRLTCLYYVLESHAVGSGSIFGNLYAGKEATS